MSVSNILLYARILEFFFFLWHFFVYCFYLFSTIESVRDCWSQFRLSPFNERLEFGRRRVGQTKLVIIEWRSQLNEIGRIQYICDSMCNVCDSGPRAVSLSNVHVKYVIWFSFDFLSPGWEHFLCTHLDWFDYCETVEWTPNFMWTVSDGLEIFIIVNGTPFAENEKKKQNENWSKRWSWKHAYRSEFRGGSVVSLLLFLCSV